MGRKTKMPRTLIPMLGMIALAMIVNGVSAQERDETDDGRPAPQMRAAPAPPAVVSLQAVRSGAWLGVMIREVGADDVAELDLPEERGALVEEVPEDGPAAAAGLRADDVIVSWNDGRIESAAQLIRIVRETPAGRTVEVGYVRGGDRATATVELGERPSAMARIFPRGRMDAEHRERLKERLGEARRHFELRRDDGHGLTRMLFRGGRLGVGVQNLTDQLAEYFGADDGGVLVTSVREDSPAEDAGLRAGDVILRIADERIENPGDVMGEIGRAEPGEIELRVLRDGNERTLRATLPERSEGWNGEFSGSSFHVAPPSGAFRFDGTDPRDT